MKVKYLFTLAKMASYVMIIVFLWQGEWLRSFACFAAALWCEHVEDGLHV